MARITFSSPSSIIFPSPIRWQKQAVAYKFLASDSRKASSINSWLFWSWVSLAVVKVYANTSSEQLCPVPHDVIGQGQEKLQWVQVKHTKYFYGHCSAVAFREPVVCANAVDSESFHKCGNDLCSLGCIRLDWISSGCITISFEMSVAYSHTMVTIDSRGAAVRHVLVCQSIL